MHKQPTIESVILRSPTTVGPTIKSGIPQLDQMAAHTIELVTPLSLTMVGPTTKSAIPPSDRMELLRIESETRLLSTDRMVLELAIKLEIQLFVIDK